MAERTVVSRDCVITGTSLCAGSNSSSTGTDTVCVGNNSSAANGGAAFGLNTHALDAASAFGPSANATGVSSCAFGPASTCSGDNGVAVGSSANSGDPNSVAVGANTLSTQGSLALGANAQAATAPLDVALGNGAATSAGVQFALPGGWAVSTGSTTLDSFIPVNVGGATYNLPLASGAPGAFVPLRMLSYNIFNPPAGSGGGGAYNINETVQFDQLVLDTMSGDVVDNGGGVWRVEVDGYYRLSYSFYTNPSNGSAAGFYNVTNFSSGVIVFQMYHNKYTGEPAGDASATMSFTFVSFLQAGTKFGFTPQSATFLPIDQATLNLAGGAAVGVTSTGCNFTMQRVA